MNNVPVSQEVLDAFCFTQPLDQIRPHGNGHINDTYLITESEGDQIRKYILQHVNTDIFRQPIQLMENIEGVTSWLREKILAAGGDPARETLHVRCDHEGHSCYQDSNGEYWRVFDFIENITCFDQVRTPEDFYQSAVAFGHFQYMLSDYPAEKLHETIPDFHNTPKRLENFEKAVAADTYHRAGSVTEEIAFIENRKDYTHTLTDMLASGRIPLRVTHNDTKLNNILFDNDTGKSICIIDLDTVMPGLSATDFGDAIRFGASTAAEDETDLFKVSCDLSLFEIYVKGFIEGCGGSLTSAECLSLIDGAIMMTLENGIRFLTDYLEGDHYFKIAVPDHNLRRARTQLKLVMDMEAKREQMEAIIRKYM